MVNIFTDSFIHQISTKYLLIIIIIKKLAHFLQIVLKGPY